MMDTAKKIDLRLYIAIILLHWKVIIACFLWAVLAGVLFIEFTPAEYETSCKVITYRDPLLSISSVNVPFSSFAMHTYLLQNPIIHQRVKDKLTNKWKDVTYSVKVKVERIRGGPHGLIRISLNTRNPRYAEDFLNQLLIEHRNEWELTHMEALRRATSMLQEQLVKLEDKIKAKEEEMIEYQRLHDIARLEARGSSESRYLISLMDRRNMLTTELMLLEAQHPELKSENPVVISQTRKLIADIATDTSSTLYAETDEEDNPITEVIESIIKDKSKTKNINTTDTPEEERWRQMRVKLESLKKKEKEMAVNLQPEHPQLKAIRKEILELEETLKIASETEMAKIRDRIRSLRIAINALENAEYQWQARNLLASQRQAELRRIANELKRMEEHYNIIFRRLYDTRVDEELKAEHFRVTEPPVTSDRPVWPDPLKILLISVVLGLCSGTGIALLTEIFNNKVQSIQDIENVLGLDFIGGIPYWTRKDEKEKGPIGTIITTKHSGGALEAYRVIRTSLLGVLSKVNSNSVIFTSADTKEGKTLTILNLAIVTAQTGKRVLLVDMDIRRGKLHYVLNMEKKPGISDVVTDRQVKIEEIIKPTSYENLDFIARGGEHRNISEALQASQIDKIFDSLREKYDYIFVDTAPVLRVADTAVIVSKLKWPIVYVVRINYTPLPIIKYSLNLLRDANVVGVILNYIEFHRISSLYYAYQYPNYSYYSNAYRYGYDYYYGDEIHGGRRTGGGSIIERIRSKIYRTFLPFE